MESAAPQDGPPDRIAVVLLEPQGPRNVGAVARAMQNFGLSDLRCVRGVDPLHPEALGNAVTAKPLLHGAKRFEELDDALADLSFVVGTTARRRERSETFTPREAAPRILNEAQGGTVGLLFGRENHGMTAEELRCCHITLNVPVAPSCRALNLAQAVALVSYEIFLASSAQRVPVSTPFGHVLTQALVRRLEEELLNALTLVGAHHEGTDVACRQSIRRVLTLGPMQTRDARWLFKLARGIEIKLQEPENSCPDPSE